MQKSLGWTGRRENDNVVISSLSSRQIENMSSLVSPPGKAATLHDVAREAGVSLITASRALSNPTLVSDKTIERVQQAVTATGYIPRAMMRCEGFRAAVGREVPTAIVPAPSSVEWGRRAMAQLLEKDPHLQAVYCSSDGFAQGLMI